MSIDIVPDFDDMYKTAEIIMKLQEKVFSIELDIDNLRDKITREVTTNSKYYINGKAPSMEFVKNTFHVGGLDGEIMDLRRELMKAQVLLDYEKHKFEIMKNIVTVYVTESASKRASVL